ncbi:MAG: helix-turn-helix transcriptional regulator [Oscillospiraceae bacterium]|nr:helix-turn-helix transcriptional regulator [Oscillospiraceae bacterium]
MQKSMFVQLNNISFEQISFAHNLIADNYSYHAIGETAGDCQVLEIGFVEENPVVCSGSMGDIVFEENGIFIIPPNYAFSIAVEDPERIHRHTSAEFLIRCDSSFTDTFILPRGKSLTLPFYLAPSAENSEIIARIRDIACAQTAQLQRNYFEECADFMALLAKICDRTQHSLCAGDTASPGNRRHCIRAKAYISENIDKRLTVSDVANAIGVSKNYLTNVFSSTEGMPLMEYINRSKLSYMMLLIRRYDYTLAQAGKHVGFSDVNYISRIFKRYYGMTVTEYKRSQERE